jgi:PAS domain S-box-containing protein
MDYSAGWPTGAAPAPEYRAEDKRLAVLACYRLDEVVDDPEISAIIRFAAHLCGAEAAHISIAGADGPRLLALHGDALTSAALCLTAMIDPQPTEFSDASADPRFADSRFAEGGGPVRFFAAAPLISHEGAPLGALCVAGSDARADGLTQVQREGLLVLAQAVMQRLRARRQRLAAEAREQESARTMREIADLLPSIVWSADGEGNFDYFNAKWTDITGAERPRTIGDWRPVVHEEDAAGTFKAWERSFAKGRLYESEYRLKQADGTWRWTLSRALPVRDAGGAVTRWYGTLTDIDDGRRLSESRDLLARELSHRIKNIFAVVAGLVAIRARKHPEVREFADELNGAIRSLGRAHDFVRPIEGEKGDSLRGLLAELMAPYAAGEERVVIEGGDCAIGARAATPLALIFHELATNSAKYGALSVGEGKVRIVLDCPDGHEATRLHWREEGGPEVAEERVEGFGSRLLTMAVEGQLGGTLERRYLPEGLEVDLAFKTSAIRS